MTFAMCLLCDVSSRNVPHHYRKSLSVTWSIFSWCCVLKTSAVHYLACPSDLIYCNTYWYYLLVSEVWLTLVPLYMFTGTGLHFQLILPQAPGIVFFFLFGRRTANCSVLCNSGTNLIQVIVVQTTANCVWLYIAFDFCNLPQFTIDYTIYY